jgi:NADPH:quinone reductase
MATGKLKPHIHEQYPLAMGAKALRAMMERQVLGKLVVTI